MGPRKEYHGEKQDVATDKWLKGACHVDKGKKNSTLSF
jgi:hypothetical protein